MPRIDRYGFREFEEFVAQRPSATSHRIGRLAAEQKLPGQFARLLGEEDLERPVLLTMETPLRDAPAVADLLGDLDREMRRAALLLLSINRQTRLLPDRTRSAISPRPVTPRHGRLVVLAGRQGSLIFDLGAIGVIADFLLSDPVQFFLTVHWLWDRRPMRWSSLRRPVVPGEVTQIAEQLGRNAETALEHGQPVRYHLRYEVSGSLDFDFRSLPPGS